MRRDLLPVSKEDMEQRGWYYLDYIIVSGDAYVDHPSFGTALIGRWLEKLGYRVGVIAQPDWRNNRAFETLGRPRYAFLITAGNLDSMVSNYTAAKRRRRTDEYSAGGRAGQRPDRATLVYVNRVREAFPGIPIIIGGIEASLRRLAHYDYWEDRVRKSLLVDSGADLLVFGMGELQIGEISERLKKGAGIGELTDIRGTAFLAKDRAALDDGLNQNKVELPSFEEVAADKKAYAKAFRLQYLNQNPQIGKVLVQPHGSIFVVQNPPARPLTAEEMDSLYAMPFTKSWHPTYNAKGGVPALAEVEFSVTSHRGCFGGCAFCALNFHQGRVIQSRSQESVLEEIRQMTESPSFKGIVHDVGGPTANFRRPSCRHQKCTEKLCLHPEPCRNLKIDHKEYMNLLRKARELPGVNKVFVRSGVRFDYLMADKGHRNILKELCQHHISGQMKVAPEHVAKGVTSLMRKSPKGVFENFRRAFQEVNQEIGKKQYLVPYFIASHPGTTLRDAVELAEFIRDLGYYPEQVQDFTPTPGSLATCMYYTGYDPLKGKKVYVPRREKERSMQRALLQYRNPKNHELVREALRIIGRTDLIGYGPRALVPPGDSEDNRRRGRGDAKVQGRRKGKGQGRHRNEDKEWLKGREQGQN